MDPGFISVVIAHEESRGAAGGDARRARQNSAGRAIRFESSSRDNGSTDETRVVVSVASRRAGLAAGSVPLRGEPGKSHAVQRGA